MMMTIATQLFEGNLICLGPLDHDKDPSVMAGWSEDPEYARLINQRPALPLSIPQMKKRLEAIEKQIDESKNQFYFTIRLRAEDPPEKERLVGFARLYSIAWNLGMGRLRLGIGDPADRGKGYGRETLKLITRFAFRELNLFALRVTIPEYNLPAIYLFEKSGFIVEVRQRQEIYRDGKYWDLLHLGLLQPEWEAAQ
jgi:RimJ/RimL family protein N-acetyltransferase